MSASVISESVRKEQLIIAKRCEEIDNFTKALEDEHKAYADRADTLQALLELYENTAQSIEEAKATQSRIIVNENYEIESESMATPRLAALK